MSGNGQGVFGVLTLLVGILVFVAALVEIESNNVILSAIALFVAAVLLFLGGMKTYYWYKEREQNYESE